MNDKNSDRPDLPEGESTKNPPLKGKKKKPDKDRKPGEENGESPSEEIDLETGLPPMKW
jgi:hypothetical protein